MRHITLIIISSGKPADTRTPEQRETLRKLLTQLHKRFPKSIIAGHNVFDKTKACPCFDAVREYNRTLKY